MSPTRRTLLKYGLLGSAALAIGGTGLALRRTRAIEAPRPLRVLDASTYSVLAAVTGRMLPPAPAPDAPDAREVAARIDELLSLCHPGVQSEIRQGLGLIENALAGLLLTGTPRPFTQCTPDIQTAILDAWRDATWSVQRKVFKAVRSLVVAAYYGDSGAWPEIGYPGPPAWDLPPPLDLKDPTQATAWRPGEGK